MRQHPLLQRAPGADTAARITHPCMHLINHQLQVLLGAKPGVDFPHVLGPVPAQ